MVTAAHALHFGTDGWQPEDGPKLTPATVAYLQETWRLPFDSEGPLSQGEWRISTASAAVTGTGSGVSGTLHATAPAAQASVSLQAGESYG